MSTFRLATVNVHLFRNPTTYDSNITDLVSILEPLNLDLIACEEVINTDKWPKFCQRLSLPYQICNANNDDYFGNGIVSRYPILNPSYQTSVSCPGELRSLLYCTLDCFNKLTIGVTHLDDSYEETRVKQIKELDPCQQNIDILMGDFNAITRDDYSEHYYREIVERKREEARCEKPSFDLTNLITNVWNYEDAFKLVNPHLKDEQIATSRFGTRIDYIYVQPHLSEQWTLTKCQIINTNGATDHNIVFAEFTKK